MRIWLTLWSILNYIYNNLIDLVWTKKIRFADGTEMDTVPKGNSLYDIKTLSQAIADKGFAFMCKNVRVDFGKDVLPTMYNDILNKYNNSDFELVSSVVDNLSGAYSSIKVKYNYYKDTYVGYLDGDFYISDYKDFSVKTQITLQRDGRFYLGKNINFIMDYQNSWMDVYDSNWNFVKTFDLSQFYNWDITADIRSYYDEDKSQFVFGLTKSDGNTQKYYRLYINDIVVSNETTDQQMYTVETVIDEILSYIWTDNTYTTLVNQISGDGGGYIHPLHIKWVKDGLAFVETSFCLINITEPKEKENNIVCAVNSVLLDYASNKAPYDVSSIMDTENYFAFNGSNIVLQDNITNKVNGQFFATVNDYNNNVCLVLFEEKSFKVPMYNYKGGNTYDFKCLSPVKKITNYDYSTYGTVLKYFSDNLLLLQKGLYRINNNTMEEVFAFTNKISDNSGSMEFCDIVNGVMVISSNSHYYYADLQKKVYTDTYEINGSSVAINYYKYNDFKICLADGGTNDTNLETILNYFGYYNYFRLDIANETISLPRNFNLYTQMFVDDNFVDNLDNISGVATRLLPQANEIVVDNASISVDLKANTNYKFTNSAITDITISSCQDSSLDIYIKFTTGGSAPTLTDNSGIVWADGQPVLQANKTYVIVIVDKIAYYKEF